MEQKHSIAISQTTNGIKTKPYCKQISKCIPTSVNARFEV